MRIYIQKFVIINNYGNVNICRNGKIGSDDVQASKSNNGATGPVIADFVNGRRVRRGAGTRVDQASFQTDEALDNFIQDFGTSL
jgi:hypothetical protein